MDEEEQRDAAVHPDYVDDASLDDSVIFLRRISPRQLKDDGKGGKRITSDAFANDPEGGPTSFYAEHLLPPRELRDPLAGAEDGFLLACIPLSAIRSAKQRPSLEPLCQDGEHEATCPCTTRCCGHAHAAGAGRKTTGRQRAMSKAAVLLEVEPFPCPEGDVAS